MYVPQQALIANAVQSKMALERLTRAALAYTQQVGTPNFLSPDATAARSKALSAGSTVADFDLGKMLAPKTLVSIKASHPIHPSGWSVVGARKY